MQNRTIDKMAIRYSEGETMTAIASDMGKSIATVSRALQSKRARYILEQAQARLCEEAVTTIVDSTIVSINTAARIHSAIASDGQLPEHLSDPALAIKYADTVGKREQRVLESVGLLASHAPSAVYQQIIANTSVQVISPILQGVLAGVLDVSPVSPDEPPIYIDAEPEPSE